MSRLLFFGVPRCQFGLGVSDQKMGYFMPSDLCEMASSLRRTALRDVTVQKRKPYSNRITDTAEHRQQAILFEQGVNNADDFGGFDAVFERFWHSTILCQTEAS